MSFKVKKGNDMNLQENRSKKVTDLYSIHLNFVSLISFRNRSLFIFLMHINTSTFGILKEGVFKKLC